MLWTVNSAIGKLSVTSAPTGTNPESKPPCKGEQGEAKVDWVTREGDTSVFQLPKFFIVLLTRVVLLLEREDDGVADVCSDVVGGVSDDSVTTYSHGNLGTSHGCNRSECQER